MKNPPFDAVKLSNQVAKKLSLVCDGARRGDDERGGEGARIYSWTVHPRRGSLWTLGHVEEVMSLRSLASRFIAAAVGASMLALSLCPASALTLASPALQEPVVSVQIHKVWWR